MLRTVPQAVLANRSLSLTPARMQLGFIALAAMLLGTEGMLRRPLTGEMSFVSIVLAEHLLLAIFAMPVAFTRRRQLAGLSGRDWAVLLGIGWGASADAALLFTKALVSGHPTTASLLQNVQPLIVVILSMVVLKERIARYYWPCLAAAMLGAYLLSFGLLDPRSILAADDTATAALALGAAALWGAGTVLGRIALARLSYVTLTAMRILLALPFVTVVAMDNGGLDESIAGIAQSPVRIAATAFGPGLFAVLLFYRGLEGTRASHATLAEFMYPVTALAGNWLVLGIMISRPQMLGLLLVLVALVLLGWRTSMALDAHPARVSTSTSQADASNTDVTPPDLLLLPRLSGCPVRRIFCLRSVSG